MTPTLSPDGKYVYVCDRFGAKVRKFDAKTLECLAEAPAVREANGCALGKDGKLLFVINMLPTDLAAPRETQAKSVFENIEAVLHTVGFDFHDVVRTWLYLDKLLEWYDPFNRVRDAFFESRHIFGGFVPASTGIGSANVTGNAIIAGALAMRPKAGKPVTRGMLESPLQCPALDYRSSFSRAAEIVTPEGRAVFLSDTASIAFGGETAHVGDPKKQIDLTMDVVAAILKTRDMDFRNTSRAIAEAYNACQDPEAAEQLFLKLIALSNELTEEQDRYLREGFENEEELAVYDVIRSGVSLSKEDIQKAKQVAKQILEAVRNVLDKPDFWASESASSKLDIDIRDLLDTLPRSFSDEVIADRREALLTHFRDVWETLRPAS